MFYLVSHRLRLFADFGPEYPETDICVLTTVEFDENWRIAGSSGILSLLADLTNYFRVYICYIYLFTQTQTHTHTHIHIYIYIYIYIYIWPSETAQTLRESLLDAFSLSF